jgi:hypothetical protein
MVAATLQSRIPLPTARPRWPRRLTDAQRAEIIECIDDLQFEIGRTDDLTALSDDALCALLALEVAAGTRPDCDI